MQKSAAITQVSITGNVVTIFTTLAPAVGSTVDLSLLLTATFLNGVTLAVSTSSGSQFQAAFTHADYAPAADGGLAAQYVYTSAQIAYWLTIAVQMVNASRWGVLTDHGLALFTAHNLVLEKLAQNAVVKGGVPGIPKGPVSSAGADKVSVSYDTSAGLEVGAGHWNQTDYGKRFIRLLRQMGAGGLQVGTPGCGPTNSFYSGPVF